jgi:hypothetical protein
MVDPARAAATLALCGACLLFSIQARPADRLPAVTALAPERPLILPAMKAGAFSGAHGILISGSGTETVSPGSRSRKSAPKPHPDVGMCLEPLDPKLLR